MTRRLTTFLIAASLLAACAKEGPPPRSVNEFVENPMLLEAAMVRCSRNRTETRYDPECMNARAAVERIEAREEEIRRAELEARSEAKRRALRRTQQAQAEARRRAEDEERRRREAEYLAQFGVLPPADGEQEEQEPAGNVPLAVVPEATETESTEPSGSETLPAGDDSNAPVATTAPAAEEAPTELQDIREELRRRNDGEDSP
jgi:membrane protein involved in colicin uptake